GPRRSAPPRARRRAPDQRRGTGPAASAAHRPRRAARAAGARAPRRRLRLRGLGPVALALRRRGARRPRRRLPGRPVEHRRQRQALPRRLREPADHRAAEPGRAEEALRPYAAQRRLRAGRRAPLRGPDRGQVTYRNRELANPVVVGILTALGFASVYIARQDIVSTASLSYAGFFFALYLAAHLVARLTVPYADPYLLPMAGLLTGIGLTEIYRLNPTDASRQGLWIVVALTAFALTLFLLQHDYRRLESYKYLFGLGAIALLILPALPVLGTSVNGARL